MRSPSASTADRRRRTHPLAGDGAGVGTTALAAGVSWTDARGRRLACRRMPSDEQPLRYSIRTFGCQMNEHDSERIAGLYEADGMVPAEGVDDADVVVLNTCCIRENADNKL